MGPRALSPKALTPCILWSDYYIVYCIEVGAAGVLLCLIGVQGWVRLRLALSTGDLQGSGKLASLSPQVMWAQYTQVVFSQPCMQTLSLKAHSPSTCCAWG